MQTKFNIGDEVGTSLGSWVIQSITINNSGDNIVYWGPNGGAAVEDRLTLIRPKGCPFKVGDVVVESWYRYDSGFKIERFETQGDTLYAFGEGNNRKACTNKLKLIATDECPTSDNARTQIENSTIAHLERDVKQLKEELAEAKRLHRSEQDRFKNTIETIRRMVTNDI